MKKEKSNIKRGSLVSAEVKRSPHKKFLSEIYKPHWTPSVAFFHKQRSGAITEITNADQMQSMYGDIELAAGLVNAT